MVIVGEYSMTAGWYEEKLQYQVPRGVVEALLSELGFETLLPEVCCEGSVPEEELPAAECMRLMEATSASDFFLNLSLHISCARTRGIIASESVN